MRRFWVAMLGLAALIGTSTVMALGLGEIQVRSALNQPFVAQIPLLAVPTDEVDAVRVKVADSADFDRMGIERADYLSSLNFKVMSGSPPRIEISASRTVREPFLTFLLDVRSATGRVLREYTVLLDPPPPIIAGRETDLPAPVARDVTPPPSPSLPPASRATAPTPVASTSTPTATPASSPSRAPSAAPTAGPSAEPAAAASRVTPSRPSAGAGQYTVKPRETLWGVATAVRPDAGVEMNQVIYALVTANPTAFDRGRFEGLMKNVTLDVPSREAMLDTSASDAQAAVSAWRRSGRVTRGAAAATPRATTAPTRVATPTATVTATPTSTPAASATPTATPAPTGADAEEPDAVITAPDTGLPGAPGDAEPDGPTDTAGESLMDDADANAGLDDAGVDAADADADGSPADVEIDTDTDTETDTDTSTDTSTDTDTDTERGDIANAGDTDAPLDADARRDVTDLEDDASTAGAPAADASPSEGSGTPWWPLLLLLLMVGLIAALLIRRRRQEGGGTTTVVPPPPPAPAPKATSVAGATAAGAAGAAAVPPQPNSAEAAQRQADEAEALFMAAYAEEQADAERARNNQADPGDLEAIPEFDAAQVIDAPTPAAKDPSGDHDGNTDLDADSGWAKADALLSELEDPEPPSTPQADDVTEPVAAPRDITDPIDQADSHIAFGLYDDALDALDTALEGDPYRAEWLVKRAEVLLDAGRIRAFTAAAKEAKPFVSDAQWQALAASGRRVAPDEPLFGADASEPPVVVESSSDVAGPASQASADSHFDFTLDDLPPVAPVDTPAASIEPEPGSTDADNFIDFDLKFDAPEPAATTAQTPVADAPKEGLDFDLGDFDDAPPLPVATPASTTDNGDATSPPLDELDALDEFKLDDFALDDDLTPDDDAEADSDSLGTGDEAATKLDLARAYVDMGDAEMARALLGEVLVEGNDTQQDEARSLMSRLG